MAKKSLLVAASIVGLVVFATCLAVIFKLVDNFSQTGQIVFFRSYDWSDNWGNEGWDAGWESKSVQKKRQEFLNIRHVLFLYKDSSTIAEFYHDSFPSSLRGRRKVQRISSGTEMEIGGSLGPVQAKGDHKKAQDEEISGAIPDDPIYKMFLEFQGKQIKENRVQMGLELMDEVSPEFGRVRGQVRESIAKESSRADVEKVEQAFSKAEVDQTLSKLENAKDWVLIASDFTLADTGHDHFEFICIHPVTKAVRPRQPKGNETRAVISFTLRKELIEKSCEGELKNALKEGRELPLKVYAKVVGKADRGKGQLNVRLRPIAVYQ